MHNADTDELKFVFTHVQVKVFSKQVQTTDTTWIHLHFTQCKYGVRCLYLDCDVSAPQWPALTMVTGLQLGGDTLVKCTGGVIQRGSCWRFYFRWCVTDTYIEVAQSLIWNPWQWWVHDSDEGFKSHLTRSVKVKSEAAWYCITPFSCYNRLKIFLSSLITENKFWTRHTHPWHWEIIRRVESHHYCIRLKVFAKN